MKILLFLMALSLTISACHEKSHDKGWQQREEETRRELGH